MDSFTRQRSAAKKLLGLTFAILLAGCVTTIEGAKEAPSNWTGAPSSNCNNITGTYSTRGDPAPGNAYAGMYSVVWPTAGSLKAMIERGVNGDDHHGGATLDIAIDATGQPAFTALDAGGKPLKLGTLAWRCVKGFLETRSLLSGGSEAQESDPIDESAIRLWKAFDGALIAENTVESARLSSSGPSTHRRALARFYFRFAPASVVPKTP